MKNKNLIFSALLVLTMILAASCSADMFADIAAFDFNADPNMHSDYFVVDEEGAVSLKTDENLTIPSSLLIPEKVGETPVTAVKKCVSTSIVSLRIPSNVQTIKRRAFLGCENLETVEIAEHVLSIEGSAFAGCNDLKTVIINSSELKMAANAFDSNSTTVYVYKGKNYKYSELNEKVGELWQ